ncbi:MAG TPA: GNAT family N-acetyltransferase [Jatrophihabitans sp.]|uniref:GNAT family N-acetyltransferase n=1 Tax=Jatrophihabitans sp. TaxID=1932789 RepID=UPI002EF62193
MSLELHLAEPVDLDAGTLYRILQLRVDVFVVEQQCPFLELDGRDLEPGTRWLWATEDGAVIATLRILREDRGTARIGRVATARQARASGIATVLMRRALDFLDSDAASAGDLPAGIEVVLDAQSPLAGWYQRFGFEPAGAEYLEDGISHLPMRRRGQLSPQA